MRIALYQGKSWISLLIRWQTRSQYSHAAFLLDDGSVIEAWQPCVREITPFPDLHRLAASKRSEDGTAPVLGRSNTNNQAAASSSTAGAATPSPLRSGGEGRGEEALREPGTFSPNPQSAIRNPQLAALSRQHTPGTTVDIFKFITPLTPDENRQLEHFARRDVGTPYDYRSILRFCTREKSSQRIHRLFCSEQVFARCQQIGRPLLDRTEAWRVPPDWLARSPHLALDQTIVTA